MDDKTLLTLLDRFSASTLSEIDLAEGNLHIVMRKGFFGVAATAPAPVAPAGSAPVAQPVHLGIAAKAEETDAASGTEAITSPIVATFYRAPGPDVPVFVEVGKKVKAGDTLCILEAMKMMNHLEAEFDCEIVSVKANTGDLVEYGQTLFEVKRL